MRTMLSARLTAIVTLLVAALAPAAVSGIQCWQCAAVDGRKCPDNSNMVDSPQVSFISRFVDKYGDRLKAATVFRSYIQAETCRKLTQPRKHISPDPVILLPGARIIAICCKMLSDVRTTHIIPFYGNEQCRTYFSARRVHHMEAGERFCDPAERGRLRERVHGAQDRVLDQVHRSLLSGNTHSILSCI